MFILVKKTITCITTTTTHPHPAVNTTCSRGDMTNFFFDLFLSIFLCLGLMCACVNVQMHLFSFITKLRFLLIHYFSKLDWFVPAKYLKNVSSDASFPFFSTLPFFSFSFIFYSFFVLSTTSLQVIKVLPVHPLGGRVLTMVTEP